jgi:hypothetical protein
MVLTAYLDRSFEFKEHGLLKEDLPSLQTKSSNLRFE